ncbi:hypothetical protein Hanom_Chr16g01502621 [Helianthus anomalus]
MELTSRVKKARFQTFWIQMRRNKPLDKSRKTGQTSGTYSNAKQKVKTFVSTLLAAFRNIQNTNSFDLNPF